ncbi:GspH/FimT family pseudopilin [Comamonas composti]|uniref:GspH/FimT family pseudopilin n=1 Tax=Comamonas composti TaxID=408558 RepID=UPI00054EAD02|nr:GspH/FimT family pseudopilin [Comamonas composti]
MASIMSSQGRARGFTLLELLVVISIIALATAGVAVAMRDSGQAQLEREAERLAALLDSARAQARASGRPVLWRPTPQGFRFEGLPSTSTLPTAWLSAGVQVQPTTPLVLGPEPLLPPQAVVLSLPSSGNAPLRVFTDGLQPFSVESLP